jgi:hypothetical protein
VHNKPNEQTPAVEPPVVRPSIVQPIVDDLKKPHKSEKPEDNVPPVGPIHPPQSAELDQDRGGGYNANHVIPQP